MNTLHGDSLEVLKTFESNTVDALITDPPAGIGFMSKTWDGDKGGRDQWISWMTSVMQECLRVLKPGAHGLVWALPRTSHWTATALENAGFEVRDVVTHLFGTGFPKSLDISKAIDKAAGAEREIVGPSARHGGGKEFAQGKSCFNTDVGVVTIPSTSEAKQWQGFGTALKPASENWILVRKPCSEKTVAANVLKHACGGLNIDQSRILSDGATSQGRFPANLVLSHNEDCLEECTEGCAVKTLDEQSGVSSGSGKRTVKKSNSMGFQGGDKPYDDFSYADKGGGSRFFYCAKSSKADRNAGLEGMPGKIISVWGGNEDDLSEGKKSTIPKQNFHPTVKSTKLMEYLITLITPPNGIVLDPFMGSGSTGVAAKKLGFEFVGIEKEQEYFEIADKRISS